MNRSILFAFVLCTITACSTPPVIYDPSDMAGKAATGAVRPLKDLVPQDGRSVRLVFVHGVGDHCSGYALNPTTGWLNDSTLAVMGLRATTPPSAPRFININVFMGGPSDTRSGVEYETRTFSLKVDGLEKEVALDAVEITWSPLTQWIKSNQLGYDSPSTTPVPGATPTGCTQAPDIGIPSTKKPPDRLWLDRTIKEETFDRNLADAILYSGPYGAAMERGVAEALCHATTGTPDNVRCKWPTKPTANPEKVFFVTHSLGSRIIYDVFLNLLGSSNGGKANPFEPEEVRDADPAITSMLANTQAFYMMANQLSLLGLANVPKDARSGSTVLHPYMVPLSNLVGLESMMDSLPTMSTETPSASKEKVFGNVLQAIAAVRLSATQRTGSDSPKLQIVAFNDTNDLLTWHVPPWYVNDGLKGMDGRPLVDVVNVFVQNTPKLVIVELPAQAHSGYFRSNDVWTVISCGAKAGEASKC